MMSHDWTSPACAGSMDMPRLAARLGAPSRSVSSPPRGMRAGAASAALTALGGAPRRSTVRSLHSVPSRAVASGKAATMASADDARAFPLSSLSPELRAMLTIPPASRAPPGTSTRAGASPTTGASTGDARPRPLPRATLAPPRTRSRAWPARVCVARARRPRGPPTGPRARRVVVARRRARASSSASAMTCARTATRTSSSRGRSRCSTAGAWICTPPSSRVPSAAGPRSFATSSPPRRSPPRSAGTRDRSKTRPARAAPRGARPLGPQPPERRLARLRRPAGRLAGARRARVDAGGVRPGAGGEREGKPNKGKRKRAEPDDDVYELCSSELCSDVFALRSPRREGRGDATPLPRVLGSARRGPRSRVGIVVATRRRARSVPPRGYARGVLRRRARTASRVERDDSSASTVLEAGAAVVAVAAPALESALRASFARANAVSPSALDARPGSTSPRSTGSGRRRRTTSCFTRRGRTGRRTRSRGRSTPARGRRWRTSSSGARGRA